MSAQEVLRDWLWDENETTPASVQAQGILKNLAAQGFAVVHIGTVQDDLNRLARAQEAIYALHASDGQDHPWCTACIDPWPCATVDNFDRAVQ